MLLRLVDVIGIFDFWVYLLGIENGKWKIVLGIAFYF